jgi:hypothetical protein
MVIRQHPRSLLIHKRTYRWILESLRTFRPPAVA